MMERWISGLLRQVERLYNGVLYAVEHNTFDFLLRNWVAVVVVVCVVCFVVDQAMWLLRYKPYREWMRNARMASAALDAVLDGALGLLRRLRGGHAEDSPGDGGGQTALKAGARVEAPVRAAEVESAAEDNTRRISKKALREAEADPNDWTRKPATYEGVHWWEPR